jgi:hypothetical protein
MDNILKLKAAYFKGADFESNSDCAIARAAKEQLNAREVNASANYLYLNGKVFYTVEYGYTQFKEDSKAAAAKNYSDEVVRNIGLSTVE